MNGKGKIKIVSKMLSCTKTISMSFHLPSVLAPTAVYNQVTFGAFSFAGWPPLIALIGLWSALWKSWRTSIFNSGGVLKHIIHFLRNPIVLS